MEWSKEQIKKILFVITYALVLLVVVLNFDSVLGIAGKGLVLFTPFIVGLSMAFILNVIMRSIEKRLLAGVPVKLEKFKRPIALLMSLVLVIGLIFFLLFLVIPEFMNTIEIVSGKLPDAAKRFEAWSMGILGDLPIDLPDMEIDWSKVTDWTASFLGKGSSALFSTTLGITSSILSGLFNTLLGLVFAIYFLLMKETIGKQTKKLFYAYLSKEKVDKILSISERANTVFSHFVKGQFTEALIIGVLCFVGMLIFGMPYALVISALVGFTALIPVLGAFIGTGVGAFLILMVDPMKALWFIIFIVVLQQIESNLIYPKVVGDSVGLPGIWVLAAVTIGGSAYGVLGMLVGVPLSALLYSLLKDSVYIRLNHRNILIK
ncbi:MAG: AI-2E family transporter [Clostridia bacterium]|nr:AI-2E family transporter [Clostridia bacterium]